MIILASLLFHFAIGFTEESIFRLIIIKYISEKYISNKKYVILVSAFFFGIFHIPYYNITWEKVGQSIFVFFMGIYLAIIFERTQTIWSTILIHSLLNYKLGFAEYIVVHSNVDKSFPFRTIIGIILLILYIEVLFYILCYFFPKISKIKSSLKHLLIYMSYPLSITGITFGINACMLHNSSNFSAKIKRSITICLYISIVCFLIFLFVFSRMDFNDKKIILDIINLGYR